MNGVVEVQADVCKFFGLDGGQRLGHTVDERLDADEVGVRIAHRLRNELLTAAEADFEANLGDRLRKQACTNQQAQSECSL